MSRIGVLIVYPFLFHYRYGVFSSLEAKPSLDVRFLSGARPRAGIEGIPVGTFSRHRTTTTLSWHRFTAQPLAPLLVWRSRANVVIFHGDMWSATTWLGAVVARAQGKRVLFWTIGWHRPERGPVKLARLAFYRLAHGLLVYGNIAKRIGTDLRYPPELMTVIYNSHESNMTRQADSRLDFSSLPADNVESIGAVIRLNAVKRLDLVITTAHELAARGRRVRVLLAGDGPERARLEDLAARLDVEAIFVGAIYGDADLDAFYSKLSLTVVPAAVGLTAIQSLAHGVPVVSDDDDFSQMPEVEAIIEGVTGGRYRRGDQESLTNLVVEWLDQVAGHAERVRGECIDEAGGRWSPEAQSSRIEKAILGLVEHGG